MLKKNHNFQIVFLLCITFISTLLVHEANASSEWLLYDDDTAAHESSDFPYQGVRFSLPDDIIKIHLLAIEFYYSTSNGFCPVTLHITNYDHSTPVVDPIGYSAVNGWNYLDISALEITVPHNFYIILEKQDCGSPMLDDSSSVGRSFKGLHLNSLTTQFSHNLLIRAEVGDQILVPVYKEWSLEVQDKITIRIDGMGIQKIIDVGEELFTLYEDGSFEMEDGIYGFWKQRGKKFKFYLDPEDISEYIKEFLISELDEEPFEVRVIKTSFSGTIKKNGLIKGTWKAIAKPIFSNTIINGKINIEKKFTQLPDDY